jgi:hypothetical protein
MIINSMKPTPKPPTLPPVTRAFFGPDPHTFDHFQIRFKFFFRFAKSKKDEGSEGCGGFIADSTQ